MQLTRYKCPSCGGGLSRTIFHPKCFSIEDETPAFKMPLASILIAIAVLGFTLGAIHPLLGAASVCLLAYWIGWRYFSSLQCDDCSSFYFGGQLSTNSDAVRPWTNLEIKALAKKITASVALFLTIFIPLYYLEQATK